MADRTPLIVEPAAAPARLGRGPCCDSRRGTVAVNAVGILLTVSAMLLWAAAYNDHHLGEQVTDPETLERFNRFYVPSLVVNGIAVAMNLIVIFGASVYNVFLVALGMVYIVVRLVFTMAVEVDIGGAVWGKLLYVYYVWPVVWAGYMLYWHGLFVYEIRKGIMSPQTYPRERHSCCCP